MHSPPTACKRVVSGTISLPSQGFFSPFPHGTGSLSVASEYLALPDGPGRFPQGFSCPAVLRIPLEGFALSLTGLSPAMAGLSRPFDLRFPVPRLLAPPSPSLPVGKRRSEYCGPATPRSPFESHGLGSSAFARRYLRNHGCFLFLRVLRWFTSPGSPHPPMDSVDGNGCSHPLGFPIRTSPDHSLLAAPRGFSQLTTSFFAYLRLGIHTHALSSLTIKSTLNTLVSKTRYFHLHLHLCFCMPVKYSVVKDREESVQLSALSVQLVLLTADC